MYFFREQSTQNSAQISVSAKGTAPEWTAMACPWVHGNFSKNVSGVHSLHQPVPRNLWGPSQYDLPSSHKHTTPACRKIRDNTLQVKWKFSFSFVDTTSEQPAVKQVYASFFSALSSTALPVVLLHFKNKRTQRSHGYDSSDVSEGIWQTGGKTKLFNLLLQYSCASIKQLFSLIFRGYCGTMELISIYVETVQ